MLSSYLVACAVTALLPAVSLARPTPLPSLARQTYHYDYSIATVIFSDPTCTLNHYLTQGEPFSTFYPAADLLGSIVGPFLDEAIGVSPLLASTCRYHGLSRLLCLQHPAVEDIDNIADQLCV